MSIVAINEKFEKQRGKSGGFPADMHYVVKEMTNGKIELYVEDIGESANIWKLADPWGFAAFDEARHTLRNLSGICFSMRLPSEKERPKFEALKRRLSYMAAINNLSVALMADDKEERLYTREELLDRPYEVVREDFGVRGDDDTPGRLEKDFQAYLFGKGLYDNDKDMVRTNERLAILGEDFVKISKKGLCVEREFPTGAFINDVKETNRVLPTEYVDIVTLNKFGNIAVIELKFDASQLEVIAQILNYALFFHAYRKQLEPIFRKRLQLKRFNADINAYLVSNTFHKRFSAVWEYYSHGYITMKQVIMGYMPQNNY